MRGVLVSHGDETASRAPMARLDKSRDDEPGSTLVIEGVADFETPINNITDDESEELDRSTVRRLRQGRREPRPIGGFRHTPSGQPEAFEMVTCTVAEPSSRYRVATRESVPPAGDHHLLHRYRLSPHGDSYRLAAAQTALLGACEPNGTITVQHFAGSQSTPRFTRVFGGLDRALELDDVATSTTPST